MVAYDTEVLGKYIKSVEESFEILAKYEKASR